MSFCIVSFCHQVRRQTFQFRVRESSTSSSGISKVTNRTWSLLCPVQVSLNLRRNLKNLLIISRISWSSLYHRIWDFRVPKQLQLLPKTGVFFTCSHLKLKGLFDWAIQTTASAFQVSSPVAFEVCYALKFVMQLHPSTPNCTASGVRCKLSYSSAKWHRTT